MKRIVAWVMALLTAVVLLPAPQAEAAADYSWIKVKLTTNNATSLTLYLKGDYFINENGAQMSGGTLTLRAADGQLSVTHSALGEVYTGKSFSLKREKVARTEGYVTLNSRQYLGHFNIKLTGSGYIQVVNEVPLAHYLYGVVGYEMSNTFPIEALKAQAIAAKCYVLSFITASGEYYIGDTSADQVYKGYTPAYTNVISAVDSTLNQVLSYNGSILCTYFAASNGGETNLVTYAWPSKNVNDRGYAIATDSYDLINPYSLTETVKIPVNTSGSITTALSSFILAKASAQLGVSATSVYRIYSVNLSGEYKSGTTRNLTKGEMSVQVADDYGNAYDTAFSFYTSELLSYRVVSNSSLRIYWGELKDDGYYYIYHARYGHGVGLSQRGAQQRASSGQSYKDILAFYYPGASWSSITVSEPQDPVLPGGAATATPAPGEGVTAQTTGKVNFRKQPDTSATVICAIPKGTGITVYESLNGWARAYYNGAEGYVSEKYVNYINGKPAAVAASPTPTASPAASSGTQTNVSTVTSGTINTSDTNLREGPSTSYSSRGKLSSGTALTVDGQDGDWYIVTVTSTGKRGYVYKKYVTITNVAEVDTEQTDSVEADAPKVVSYGEVTGAGVNLRSGPAASYQVLDKLAKGTSLNIYGLTGSWYYAQAGSINGYISGTYVKITAQATDGGGTTDTPKTDAAETYEGMITTSGVNFRMGPETSYASLKKLTKNTGLYVLGESGSWYYVKIGDQSGYVYKSYVKITGISSDTTASTVPSGATGRGVTTGKVNLRTGPATSYAKTAVMAKGEALTLFGTSNGWYKVTASTGKEGYISGKYVEVTEAYSAADTDTDEGESGESTGTGVTTGNVNFREGPYTSAKKLAQLTKNVTVTIYSAKDGWYEAEYNGQRGYLYAKYVKVTSSAGTAQQSSATPTPTAAGQNTATATPQLSVTSGVELAAGVTIGKLNFRDKPDTADSSVLETFAKDTKLSILGQCGEWYYIIYGGKTGFVNNAYVSVTSSGSAGIVTVSSDAAARAAVTTAEVNMRAGAGTGYDKITLLPNKTSLKVLYTADGWCLVYVNGSYGFVIDDYIALG